MVNVQSGTAVQTDLTCGCCGNPEAFPAIWADDNKGICYECYVQKYDVCSHCGRLLPVPALRRDEDGERVCAECAEMYEIDKELI